MKDLLYCFLFPHFVPSLTAAAVMATLPVEHWNGWRSRVILGSAAAFLLGGCLEFINLKYTGETGWKLAYYILPILFCYGFIRFVMKGEPAEQIQALSLSYLCQHTAFCAASPFGVRYGVPAAEILAVAALKWMINGAVLAVLYRVIIKKLPKNGHYLVTLRSALVTLAVSLLIALGLNYILRSQVNESDPSYYVGTVYDVCCCVFLLWLQLEQRLSAEHWSQFETERRLRLQSKEQYEQSRTNVALINQKCHDLKHQIAALRIEKNPVLKEQGLREMEEAVLIYDAVAKTGNEVLDTVLTEKSLICEKENIQWTCMADGSLLSFMRAVDLYTLFGNAIDNAIESCMQIDDPDRRALSVVVRKESGIVLIQIENYYDHDLNLAGGLPATTKADPDQHGFGLKSIASIAGQYGGVADVKTEDGLFLLSVMIPLPI